MHVEDAGNVWSTEHGPKGGDELSFLRDGGECGWPQFTYRTQYELREWPMSRRQGSHAGFEKPVFSRVPSIEISNLLQVSESAFSTQAGELLLWTDEGSLAFMSPRRSPGGFGSSLTDCMQCHPIKDGTSHGIGPDLHGMAGRRIA